MLPRAARDIFEFYSYFAQQGRDQHVRYYSMMFWPKQNDISVVIFCCDILSGTPTPSKIAVGKTEARSFRTPRLSNRPSSSIFNGPYDRGPTWPTTTCPCFPVAFPFLTTRAPGKIVSNRPLLRACLRVVPPFLTIRSCPEPTSTAKQSWMW